MNKRCTNSSCRKNFSTLTYGCTCPFCGKIYPQLIKPERSPHRVYMRIDGKWTVFKLDEIERFYQEGRRLWGIKATKLEMERLGYFINVRHARALYESLFNNSPCINRWRTIPDPETGRRIILPLSRFE